jgi:pimeloyl-ACP methyl ester carboxylesterase
MNALNGWDASEYTPAAGTRVHAAVLGRLESPVVVCVHGLGCSHAYFLPTASELADEARVVAPDLPGFGRTFGPPHALDIRGLSLALADWLRVTARGGALLLANSAGCQVVVDLAVHAPELLGAAVLVGPTVDRRARSSRQQCVRLLADQRWESPSLAAALLPAWIACGPRRFTQTLRYMISDPVERKLHELRVPTVVVRGEHDPIVSLEWATEVAQTLPDARLVEIPRTGHTVNWSAPKELAEVVRPLLSMVRP